jgi:hypothetical protein
LFNIGFFGRAPRLHASLVGLPFRPAIFRGLRESACAHEDARYNGCGDQQAILIFHFGSPEQRDCGREAINE